MSDNYEIIIGDLTDEVGCLSNEVETLQKQLKKAEDVIRFYSDSEDDYWIDHTDNKGVHHMKNIVKLSKAARNYFKEGEK
jgi:hypothetical protein